MIPWAFIELLSSAMDCSPLQSTAAICNRVLPAAFGCSCFCGRILGILSRDSWQGQETEVEWIGLMEASNRLFSRAFKRYCSQKGVTPVSSVVVVPPCDDSGQVDVRYGMGATIHGILFSACQCHGIVGSDVYCTVYRSDANDVQGMKNRVLCGYCTTVLIA